MFQQYESSINGEELIKLLSTYITNFGDYLINGKRILRLNTLSLRYINARIREWKRKKSEYENSTSIFSFFIYDPLQSKDFEVILECFQKLQQIQVCIYITHDSPIR